MKFGIGQPMRRHEDLRLITGRGCYADDVILPRMTHAFVLRSPMAHAHIKRIDAAAARRMPGVLFVATGEDVRADGLGDVPCTVPLVNRDGTSRHDTPRPVLALGKVRHVGQPVALVVAETLTAARDAAEAIDVEYDPLPAITEAKDAISPGAPQLFDHISSNIVFDWDNDMGDAKATDATFSRAARVVTLELVNNRVVVNSMEPRNAIADFDPASGHSTLYTATQGPHFVRDPLAEAVLKIPKDMLRLTTSNVGGAFGMKAFVYPEQKRRPSAFTQALADLGWGDGRNVLIDVRWGGGDINRIRALAQELVGLQPDIILTAGEDLTAAVQRETRTIPTIPRDASPSSPRRVTIRESEDVPGGQGQSGRKERA